MIPFIGYRSREVSLNSSTVLLEHEIGYNFKFALSEHEISEILRLIKVLLHYTLLNIVHCSCTVKLRMVFDFVLQTLQTLML